MMPIGLIAHKPEELENFLADLCIKLGVAKEHIIEVTAEEKEISIDQVRAIRLSLAVLSANIRIIVWRDFHNASDIVQNAMLKLIEDSTAQNQFVFVASNEYAILPTIRSRIAIFKSPHIKSEIDIKPYKALFDALENDHTLLVLGRPEVLAMTADRLADMCDAMIYYYRARLLSDAARAPTILKKIIETKRLLLSNNLNPQLAVDSLLLAVHSQFNVKTK